MLRRSNPWLFLLLIAHPLIAQEGQAVPDSLARADSLARPDSLTPADSLAPPVSRPAPARAALVEAGAPSGYDVSPHGYRGLDVGHLNRVDGWAPSVGLTLLPVRPNALPTLDITAGVRTNRLDEPWGRLAASQIFAGLDRFQLAAEIYRDTRTPDGWKVGARENDLWVFLTRTDLRNYYDAAGVRLAASSSDLRPWGLTLALQSEHNESVDQDPFFTLTTLFGDDEDFRPNPSVLDGRVTSASLDARFVTASSQSPALRVAGWNLGAGLERAWQGLGGDVSFWRGTLHVRRYTRLAERHWLNARVYVTGPVLGTDDLPPQRFTYLGGPGSLPGFDTLELAGDRGVLGTVEYTFQLPSTSWSTPVFLLWQLEVFSNVGNAVDEGDRTRLYSDLHWDAGVGVSGVTVLGYLGLFLAQRLSDLDAPSSGPRVLFRLQRAF
ncbi:MAG TPA: BamA/TamA family outer membrane protein [Gemmatimonadota bacterium]